MEDNKIFDKQTGLLIPFKSRSDALLAQLILRHGLSKELFNSLMDIVLDPSFSPNELTLRSATDIDVRISEHRREMAEDRAHTRSDSPRKDSGDEMESAGIPHIVLEVVIDRMLDDFEHFSNEADATPGSSDNIFTSRFQVRQTELKSMSLVHRSWTELAQRALRRRVVLTSRRGLREFARSPACGVGVREFAYKLPKSQACTFFHRAAEAREHWVTFASVISRLTTLRFLCLNIESAHLADLNGLDFVLDAIGKLTNLEGLWLHSSQDHCPYLPQLYMIISKMPCLRFLSLSNWTCPREPETPDMQATLNELLQLSPLPRLKALKFRDAYLTTPSEYLAWLFKPRDSYSLEMLDLEITFSRILDPSVFSLSPSTRVDSSHLLSALSPLLPSLSSLSIKFFYFDMSSPSSMYDTDLQALLKQATRLRHLRLHRLRAGTTSPDHAAAPLVLPQTLEELHVHYSRSGVNWRTQDQRLCGLLGVAPLPRLRRVLMSSAAEPGLDMAEASPINIVLNLPRTHRLCARLGVDLVVYQSEARVRRSSNFRHIMLNPSFGAYA